MMYFVMALLVVKKLIIFYSAQTQTKEWRYKPKNGLMRHFFYMGG